MARFANDLANPNGLGGKVAAMLPSDPNGALRLVQNRLGDRWKNEGRLLQHRDDEVARSVSLFDASRSSINAGEREQGKVENDSGENTNPRTFTLVNDASSDFVQTKCGNRQKSTYSWSKYWYWGKGTDWLLPIVGKDGKIRGYVVYSEYESNYGDPKSMQRSAVRKWKRLSEN